MTIPTPLGYVCYRTAEPPAMDGTLNDPAWQNAPWTDDFQDIEGDLKPKPRYRTRVKMLWDDKYLYIGAELEEPNVWATLTQRDSVIFHDNDFEVFMDPDNDGQFYAEYEMNAFNTEWDLLLGRPYRAGGPALTGWDVKGIKSAVHVDGTINDPSDTDKGWTLEIAYPWTGISEIARANFPPKDGDQWRINFSRVEWDVDVVDGKYVKKPGPEHNWVWSPQHVIDMHRPERWGVLQFSTHEQGPVPLKPLPGMRERLLLTQIWDAQFDFRAKHHRIAHSLKELGIDIPGAQMWTTPDTFEAALGDYRIDANQRFWREGA